MFTGEGIDKSGDYISWLTYPKSPDDPRAESDPTGATEVLQLTGCAEKKRTDSTGIKVTTASGCLLEPIPCLRSLPATSFLLPRKPDPACINVISLAPLGRSSGAEGSQTQAPDSTARTDNASAVTSPVMSGINHAPVSMSASDGLQGRKRNVTIAGIDSSPGSIEDVDDNDARDDKRRQPVKRACNECRQQKVGAARRIPCNAPPVAPPAPLCHALLNACC